MTVRYPSTATREERDRLEAIARELEELDRTERSIRRERQRLRDEQAALNAKVYRA